MRSHFSGGVVEQARERPELLSGTSGRQNQAELPPVLLPAMFRESVEVQIRPSTTPCRRSTAVEGHRTGSVRKRVLRLAENEESAWLGFSSVSFSGHGRGVRRSAEKVARKMSMTVHESGDS